MRLLDKLEKRLGFLTIQNLTTYIVVGQIAIWIMALAKGDMVGAFLQHVLYRFDSFIDGKPWTIVSFLFVPRNLGFSGFDLIWTLLSWFMLYSIGSQLERAWGVFRYNVYILTSLMGVIGTSLIFPYSYMTNYYLLSSIWFAFFITFPDLPFLFGIKAKWLAVFFAVMTFMDFVGSSNVGRMLILGSLINIPIFFGRDFVLRLRSQKRLRTMKAAKQKFESEPFHTCTICGATDISHPERDFRYGKEGGICSECVPPRSED